MMSPIKYSSQIVGKEDFILKNSFKNMHQTSNLIKLSINLSTFDLLEDKEEIVSILVALQAISGQKAVMTSTKKGNPGLKIKKGMVLGAKTTLRKTRAFQFLDILNSIVLPRSQNLKIFPSTKTNHFSFQIRKPLHFLELERKFSFFKDLSTLGITLNVKSASPEESTLYLSQLFFPFYTGNN